MELLHSKRSKIDKINLKKDIYHDVLETKEIGAQIDLLFDREDGIVIICEIK